MTIDFYFIDKKTHIFFKKSSFVFLKRKKVENPMLYYLNM